MGAGGGVVGVTRIIAGVYRGRRIATPKGSATRPTSDRTREALFSALTARGVLEGARVLDLFAGSGALGIEAVSRGAVSATLVDHDRGAIAAMRRTVADLDLRHVAIRARDVRTHLGVGASEHDLVFLDPPYDLADDRLGVVLESLTDGWLAEGALVVVERSTRSAQPPWPDGLRPAWSRSYGDTTVWVAEVTGPT